MKRLLVYLMLVSPAYAAHCPYGQIYRVHLGECVDHNSILARAYVGKSIHIPKLKREPVIIPAVVQPDPLPVEDIYPPEIMFKLRQGLDKLMKTRAE